jgi:hypothetical protein
MKKILYGLALVLPLYACGDGDSTEPKQQTATEASAGISLSQQWETEGLRVPESVLYYQGTDGDFLLVSEIEGDGSLADGKGGIAKMSLTGEILAQDWVRGLNAPKGMGAHDGKLYVADLQEVAVIDIATRAIETRIPVADSVFLNDIAIDDAGVVYVSDTRTHKVHRIENGVAEVYLDDLEKANGLTSIDSDLYVAAGNALWKVDADKKLTKIFEGFEENADGVEMVAPGEFIVSCWAGIVYQVDTDGELSTLLDTREAGKNTADIGWNAADNIMYVPTFLKRSVVAYELSQ